MMLVWRWRGDGWVWLLVDFNRRAALHRPEAVTRQPQFGGGGNGVQILGVAGQRFNARCYQIAQRIIRLMANIFHYKQAGASNIMRKVFGVNFFMFRIGVFDDLTFVVSA